MLKTTRKAVALAALVVGGLLAGLSGAPPAVAAEGPNGLITYQCFGPLGTDICVLDPANPGAVPTNLTNDSVDDDNPDWSPDGTKIAFDSFRSTNQPTIHTMNPDGTEITKISSTPCCDRDFEPKWSPDGTKIAFVSTRDGDGEYEIYVMGSEGEIVGSPAVRLTNDPAAQFGQGKSDWQITWSPTSARIAFVSNRDPESPDSCDIWAMDTTDADGDGFGDNLTRLTFEKTFNCDRTISPAWSPDGSRIAFGSFRSGDSEIWLINADGSNPVNVTNSPASQEYEPEWSPDGTQIIFTSTITGNLDLHSVPAPSPAAGTFFGTADAGGSSGQATWTQLTTSGGDDRSADWGGAGGTTPPPPTSHTLTVTRSGDGTGSVVSTPAGIKCGADCTETYAAGTAVTLTAKVASGTTFAGWSGACSGTATTCTVTMDAAKSVTATFTTGTTPPPGGTHTLSVTRSGDGKGNVTSSPAGISCGRDCSEAYASGTAVTLTATPAAGYSFTSWSGACSGTATTCTVTMDAAKSVTATFGTGGTTPPPGGTHTLTVTKSGLGGGRVTSSPAGISCGTDCSEAYASGTQVTLTATAASGSTFTGWSGACSGTGATCTVTMDAAKTATATFAKV